MGINIISDWKYDWSATEYDDEPGHMWQHSIIVFYSASTKKWKRITIDNTCATTTKLFDYDPLKDEPK